MRQKMVAVVATVFLMLVCSASGWAATVSGFVNYAGAKSGRVFIRLSGNMGGDADYGVSVPVSGPTPVAFSIRGVPQNSYSNYTLSAYMDTQGNGIRHANDPFGQKSVMVNSSTVDVNLTLADPTPVSPTAAEIVAYQGNGGNMVLWYGHETAEGVKKANRYRVSWSTNGGSTVEGYVDLTASDDDMYFHRNGNSGHSYRVTALVGASEASTPWSQVQTRNGGATVSGTVNLGGITPTGPLAVVLANESGEIPIFLVHVIPAPSSTQAYSFANVAAGKYTLHAILDMNNNGTFDDGDIAFQPDEYMAPAVDVAGSPVTVPAITFTPRNADALVRTSHIRGSFWTGDQYSVGLQVDGQLKRPVNVAVSKQGVLETTDIGFNQWGEARIWFQTQTPPKVDDSYSFVMQYLDGSSETITAKVTAVLNSFPQPIAPVGLIQTNPTPTFSWTAPPQPPVGLYSYSVWFNGKLHRNDSDVWWSTEFDIPPGQLSVAYNADGSASLSMLEDGDFNWAIQVLDKFGNSAQYQTSFMMTSDPAIGGFSPAGGLAGSTVTISGINFSTTLGNNTVRFNGIQATVTAATATSLTVTVPNGATTGLITVAVSGKTAIAQSKNNFIVGTAYNVQGKIQTSAGVNIAGALVQKNDDPSISATTAADGTYILGPVFEGQDFDLKITKTGYVPTYTGMMHVFQSPVDTRQYPSHLYSTAEYAALNIPAGRGAVFGQVMNQAATPFTPVPGVVVSAASAMNMGISLPVTYYNGTVPGGSSTYDNGIFMVLNIANNDAVNVEGTKSFWSFYGNGFWVRADSITEGVLFGTPLAPNISGLNLTSGNIGTSVTISGSNFSSIASENIVKFNNNVTATVTAASTNSLTVTVPYGAVTGIVSVTTPGGTSYSPGGFTVNMPTVSSTTPDFGPVGTVITVSGNFPDTNENNYRLLFGSSQQAIDSVTSNSLTFTIPGGVDPVINWSLRYSNQQVHFETFEVKNHLTLNIVGSGTVNDSPNVYTCAAATCNGDFAPVVTLTLVPTPSNGYTFKGWSGACGGTGNCVVTMNSARNVTATFELQGHVKIKDKIFYSSIQNSFNAAVNDDIILIQALTDPFVENLLFNRTGATVKVQGGWDVAFGSNNNSFSVVDGSLKVTNGTLKVEKLKIR